MIIHQYHSSSESIANRPAKSAIPEKNNNTEDIKPNLDLESVLSLPATSQPKNIAIVMGTIPIIINNTTILY